MFALGRTTASESLFSYKADESHDKFQDKNFQPIFKPDSSKEAEQVCGNKDDCLFDFAVAGEDFAKNTADAITTIEDQIETVKPGMIELSFIYFNYQLATDQRMQFFSWLISHICW